LVLSVICKCGVNLFNNPEHTKSSNYNKKKTVVSNIVSKKKKQNLINPIPLYDFYAAAGTFSEMQSNKEFTFIEGPEKTRSNSDYFACKIKGESMNRVIPNGSICLFKKYPGGSRNSKIVLVENMDIQDQDFNSAFTIKTYSSEKEIFEESYEHKSIVLRPNSFDTSYKNIIINAENGAAMRIVGEFVSVL
jgi:SOS-response transcriptional repressor LexA